MAKRKKKTKIDTLSIVLLLLIAVGAICAIVGLFTDWFVSTTTSALLGSESSTNYGLFAEEFTSWAEAAAENENSNLFPIALVQSISIGAAVLAGVCLLFSLLSNLGIFSLGGLIKLILSIAAGVLGVFVIINAGSYIGSLAVVDLGVIVESTWTMTVGVYLTGVGAIIAGAGYLLSK